MNIVTTADTNFFHCLQQLAESVKTFYNKQLIVYDIGLTEKEKKSVDAFIIPITVDVDFLSFATFCKGSSNEIVKVIKTTHKPFCVKHYFEHHSEPMILVDADCTFNERVEETGFDVGITLRRRKRVDLTNPWTGIINAGVIFFNTYARELINTWAQACLKENTTDQKELTEILSETIDWKHYNKVYDWHGIKVKMFNAEEYNDVRLKKGKIYHFNGKKHNKEIYEQLLEAQSQGRNMYDVFNKLTGRKRKPPLYKLINRILSKVS